MQRWHKREGTMIRDRNIAALAAKLGTKLAEFGVTAERTRLTAADVGEIIGLLNPEVEPEIFQDAVLSWWERRASPALREVA